MLPDHLTHTSEKGEKPMDRESVTRVCADYRSGELTGWRKGEREGHSLGSFDVTHTPASLVNWVLLHVSSGVEVDIVGRDGKRIVP